MQFNDNLFIQIFMTCNTAGRIWCKFKFYTPAPSYKSGRVIAYRLVPSALSIVCLHSNFGKANILYRMLTLVPTIDVYLFSYFSYFLHILYYSPESFQHPLILDYRTGEEATHESEQ